MKLTLTNVLLAIILSLIVLNVSFKIIIVVAIVGIGILVNHSKIKNVENVAKRIQIPTISSKEVTKIKSFVKDNTEDLNLPPLELLEYRKVKLDSDKSIKEKAKIVVNTLKSFDVAVKFVEFTKNQSLIRLVFSTDNATSKTKIAKIKSSITDIQGSLGTSSVKFIPVVEKKKNCFALELPVENREKVTLLSVMNSEPFRAFKKLLKLSNFYNGLPIALGMDSIGKPLIADFTKFPHLLIAGATGSGKSVSVSNIITNFLMLHSPATLELLLVDAKMVELSAFEKVKHLKRPIVYTYKDTLEFLDLLFEEMSKRMELFKSLGVKEISEYNKKNQDKPLPFIVLVIDEYAELMAQAPAEDVKNAVFGNKISRLGQLARFAGIALLLSTQRPDAKVITPLLRANIPTRIGFAVSSRTNSQIILDSNDAASLLGKGDGIFAFNGSAVRFQNCYVSPEEIEGIVKWWDKNYK